MKKLFSAAALSVSLTLGTTIGATTLQANEATQTKQQSGTVINLAGKQRMLTQKMSKEALFIAKGINADANKANLAKTVALFDKTLKGLVAGDESLKLPATTNKEILAQLQVVTDLWTPFKSAIEKGDLAAINKENIPLLKNMNKAVGMYAEASGSTIDPAMAKKINLAGKQRMLSQKMTKELLLVANGIDADANAKNAKETVALFDKTLKELTAGCKQDAIKAQFGVVAKTLAEYRPIIDKVDTSDEALAKAEKLNMSLLKESNKAVQMLEASIK
ncbi:Nitric oxide-responding transcriptional regulator Dnr (Crp/Fnr family) [hydrothermal vent metagenome]|uniref:Nitric oxide-responding transcriptional regulator Dnr (Crp/Fnr family) n=1 Tax=hydrothermal vent metagenome TaxID=652676 RepID=A0A1W1BG63_9ZZZZ